MTANTATGHTAKLASRFHPGQAKGVLVGFTLFIKQENNSYRWAKLPELEAMHSQLYPTQTANGLRMETTDLQMACESGANGNTAPANGLRMACKRFAANPLAKVNTRGNT